MLIGSDIVDVVIEPSLTKFSRAVKFTCVGCGWEDDSLGCCAGCTMFGCAEDGIGFVRAVCAGIGCGEDDVVCWGDGTGAVFVS